MASPVGPAAGGDAGVDDMWMRRALELAEGAVGAGEVPVGCVFVSNGVEVACGANATNATMDATRHAELVAVDRALRTAAARGAATPDWREATLYVTCEPCIMCASALAQLGLRRCVYGCRNEKFGGCGSILPLDTFPCAGGVREAAAVDLFRRFYDRANVRTEDLATAGDTRAQRRRKAAAAGAGATPSAS